MPRRSGVCACRKGVAWAGAALHDGRVFVGSGVTFARIERERFQAPLLARLQASLSSDGAAPSRRIARLRRLVARYGGDPRFVLASATIGNPVELAERLERDAVELALQLAEKIVVGAIEADPERVLDVVRGGLRGLVDRSMSFAELLDLAGFGEMEAVARRYGVIPAEQ